ncbi:UDP-glucose dehydrogenase family protein [Humidisolicoccus flavus]|uniref:UDP-glucose dehydrogenase family protein n=1 Tax=Humidisolicoccus flavus TaxID=3111414 RepID=UPI003249CFE6
MKIAVVGCGYLGAVHAASMASLGHETVGIDVDERKLALLSSGRAPFYEPGFDELLQESIASGKLRFDADPAAAADAEVIFIGVGTPQKPGSNAADLKYVDAAIDGLLPHIGAHTIIAGKSTVPVGTNERLRERIEATGARLVWNPEFLREGFAVQDTLEPDRLVYGIPSHDHSSEAVLDQVYASILDRETPKVVTDPATAELVKVSANAFLATKISFINAMAEIAEATGADVTELADAIGMDVRIGRKFLNSGLGFGGGCLPKDIRAFRARTEELGLESVAFLDDIDQVNLRRREKMVSLVLEALEGAPTPTVAMLGLAFKPNSDDVRDSPALAVAAELARRGAIVQAFDPEALQTAAAVVDSLDFKSSINEALEGASVIAIGTEWKQFSQLDPEDVATRTAARIVIDGRNTLDRDRWHAAGFTVIALGRPRLEVAPA